jgi:hypothetical protein
MRYNIPIEIIELEKHNYHLIVTSVFANGEMGYWVIDTGASKSIFDKNLVDFYTIVEGRTENLHSAGIGEEPLQSEVATMKPFSFAGMKIEKMQLAVLDLTHINELYSASTDLEICGLLGGDFLVQHKAVIDYKKRRMILR